MLLRERQNRIIGALQTGGAASVRELAAALDVSESTIRRDLELLDRNGELTRTYGGAVLKPRATVETDGQSEEGPYDDTADAEHKTRVARAAADLVQDGSVVILDIGTTTPKLAGMLRGRDITVVTSNLAVFDVLRDDDAVRVVLLGGVVRRNYHTLVGSLAQSALSQISADVVFLSCTGVRANGHVVDNMAVEAPIKQAMIAASSRVVLLATEVKFPGTGALRLCSLADVDVLVTTAGRSGRNRRTMPERRPGGYRHVKLSILGGGGFRTPYVYQALLRDTGTPRVTEVALYDIDEMRLGVMTAVLAELAAEFPDPPRVTPTTIGEEAIEGSDFVFAAIRVAGLEGRRCDEHVALDLGVLGQETTGPGGLAYAIRTVPVMTGIAKTVRSLAPDAYVMNFTNPAGIITEAMQSVLGDRVLGICDTPSGLGRRVAGVLGLDHRRVQMDYVGLNHLGWMRRVLYDGRDILPDLLADEALLGTLEEGEVFGTDWIRTLGVIPNEYLFYYYSNRDAVRAILDSGATRGDFLARTQAEFYRLAAERSNKADLWRETVARRSASYMAEAKGGTQDAPPSQDSVGRPEIDPAHQGYAGVALGVMNAITRNERATMILNVRNQGTIAALPDDAVVEVSTLVDANGVHPLSTAAPGLHEIGLMAQVKEVERHTIRAALTGSRAEALQAFALHPLVDSTAVARQLVDGYIDQIPEVAAVLTR